MGSEAGRELQNWKRGDRAYIRCLAVVFWDLGVHNKDELTKSVNKVLGFDWKSRFDSRMTNNALAQRADKARRISTEAPEVNKHLSAYWKQAKIDVANGKTSFPFDTYNEYKLEAETENGIDCYHRALPGEPTFTLLARDPDFARLVSEWAQRRAQDINCGLRPDSDREDVRMAFRLAEEGATWRKNNDGKWRK